MFFDVEKSICEAVELGDQAFQRAMRRAEIERSLREREQRIEDAKRLLEIHRHERDLKIAFLKESVFDRGDESLSHRSFTKQDRFAQLDVAFELFKKIRSLDQDQGRRLYL